jgi:hypothetical protein
MNIQEYNKAVKNFERIISKSSRKEPTIKRTIFHTGGQYLVKLPGEIMRVMNCEPGDCLTFTLETTVKNNKIRRAVKIEYEKKKR